jgi:hypothetical protein
LNVNTVYVERLITPSLPKTGVPVNLQAISRVRDNFVNVPPAFIIVAVASPRVVQVTTKVSTWLAVNIVIIGTLSVAPSVNLPLNRVIDSHIAILVIPRVHGPKSSTNAHVSMMDVF